jgi:catechol 2,3-dioxygenase-like lactoylglutathione lyase family enzyme
MRPEPIFDLAHLGHMELLTPKPDESLTFFVDVMGMTVSGRKGDSVYLRRPQAWSTWRCGREVRRRWTVASPH